jgi:GTP-binding protein
MTDSTDNNEFDIDAFFSSNTDQASSPENQHCGFVAIVGRPNVGKSTLTNRILGEERVVVYDMPGTTRDSIYIPMERDGREYVLIDTAGVRRRTRINETVEKFSVVKTLKAVEDANVVMLVIDARENISDQDLSLLGFALNAGRSIVIAVNKWDGLDMDVKEQVKKELDRRLGFVDFARIHFISALHGTGVGHLFESVQEAYKSATTRVGTSVLTRIMKMATDDHQPPLVRGRRVKLKYAHAGGYNPPIVVIHGNQVNELPDSYKRYLMNYYRKSLEIMGTPIRIQFQNSDNPFEGKSNKMTLSQERKRKRLMSMMKNRKN